MSINHYSSLDLPETTLWWTQHQPHPQQDQQQQQHQQHIVMEPIPNPSWPLHHHRHHHNQPTWFNSHQDPSHKNPTVINTPRFNLNNEEDEQEDEEQPNNNNEQATTSQEGEGGEEGEEEEEKEPMFEKPLTPSDVGKLNRLVIPKQHAEKYFPLGAANSLSSTASDSGECKGLLLSFEDESGKCWRFRYSYWNSSQSYVLTKGWSRYVKDKRLDAGDVVSFERHRGDLQRLFIRWRRRSAPAAATATTAQVSRGAHGGGGGGDGNNGNMKNGGGGGGGGVGVGWTSGYYCAHPSYPTHHHHHQQLAYQQQHEGLHAGKGSQDLNQRTRPLGNCSSSSSSSSSKVLRLFGVNMECQPQDDSGPSTPECSYNMQSTQGADTNHLYHLHQPPNSYSSNSHPHMVRQQPYYY